MKKETKIICGSVLAFLIVLFGIVAIIIHESPQIQRETHPTDITVNEFVRQIAPAAQREQKKYRIPASITIAQAGLESNWGRSRLANKYNNLFGIKANSDDDVKGGFKLSFYGGLKMYDLGGLGIDRCQAI